MKILVIDDSKLNLEYAKSLLSSNDINCEILTCESGVEGLNILEKENIDIVLLDIVMPEMTGIEVLQRIRTSNKNSDIIVIMFTSLLDREILKKSFDFGASDYINKPIDVIEFLSRIKAAIRLRQYQIAINATLNTVQNQNNELKQLNQELKQTKDYLVQKEKLVAIGELAAGVAHEINNPLSFISSNVETLSIYVEKFKMILNLYKSTLNSLEKSNIVKVGEVKEKEKEVHLDFIIEDLAVLLDDTFEGIDRVAKIVKTLRNFARDDLNKELDFFNINDIIEETLLLLKNEYKYSININQQFNNIACIKCSKIQISQVILNIIMNAIQAIKSQTKEQKGQISIKTYREEQLLICEISDDGPGMDDQVLNKIFNPFFTTKKVGQGTGLGLSIAYDIIVNKHHGDISAKSEKGKGTVFKIELPY